MQETSFLRAPEAAAYLNLSQSYLAKLRIRGNGPRFIRAGGRAVLYDRLDLDTWIESRKRQSTSESAAAA